MAQNHTQVSKRIPTCIGTEAKPETQNFFDPNKSKKPLTYGQAQTRLCLLRGLALASRF